MNVSRRSFLKLSAAGAFAATFGCTDRDRPVPKTTEHQPFRTELKSGTETTTICPFCGVGCGAIVTTATINGAPKIVNIEGDPDHPINRGALCSKGSSMYQIANQPLFSLADEPSGNNGRRLANPMKRLAGTNQWTEITWQTAITEIAAAMQATRDAAFVTPENRCENMYCLGGAALDNEECYLISKMARALGIAYLEHQARI